MERSMIYQATKGHQKHKRVPLILVPFVLLCGSSSEQAKLPGHKCCSGSEPVWYRTSMPNDVLSGKRSGSRRFAPLGIIFGLAGLLLFAYFVSRAGVGEIVSRIQRLGAGFLLILAVSSVRYLARALAWIRCVERPDRLPF